jgi:putative ABC transport system ATP-binding protein
VLVELAGVEKVYVSGAVTTPALRGVDLTIGAGEMVAIVGPSGSGKSTVTDLIAGIDRPSAGTVTVAGQRIDTMGARRPSPAGGGTRSASCSSSSSCSRP